MKHRDHSGNEFFTDDPLPCPFCGSEPTVKFRGNDRTKSRMAIIKCSDRHCRAEMTVGAIRNTAEWAARIVIEHWNRRAPVPVKIAAK